MSSDSPRLFCVNNAIRLVKNSSLTSKKPVNHRPSRMCRLIHRKLKYNTTGQLIMTPRPTQQSTLKQDKIKHCCPEELLNEILYEERVAEDLKPQIRRIFGKKRKTN